MKIKHIYWFAPYNLTCPSTRYRGKYPLEYLNENQQITYDFVTPNLSLKGMLTFFKIIIKILLWRKPNSVIVIQKIITNRVYANMLKILISIRNQQTLYDLDDAEYLRTSRKSLDFFIKKCTDIQVGSLALKNYCLRLNSNVFINTSPVCHHKNYHQKRNEKLHIGWVGDTGNGKLISKDFAHKTSLFSILFPAISQLPFPIQLTLIGVKQNSDIQLIKSYFENNENIEVNIPENLNWQNDDWVYPMISTFDVGVSPMVNHPFNQAKSAFKAKQYLSCAIPVVASDIGENAQFVKHEKNGFLCNNSADFTYFLTAFAKMNSEDYQSFCNAAIASKSSFSMNVYCKSFIDFIESESNL